MAKALEEQKEFSCCLHVKLRCWQKERVTAGIGGGLHNLGHEKSMILSGFVPGLSNVVICPPSSSLLFTILLELQLQCAPGCAAG